MKIAKLDGSTIGDIADHKSLFPNISFPKAGPNADWLADNSCAEVVVFLAFDSATQKNESVTPYLSDGKVYTRRVTDMTNDEKAAVVTAANAAIAARNRTERDKRLASCDWMANSDVTISDAWRTYRAALRDVPAQSGFPNSINWPVEPS